MAVRRGSVIPPVRGTQPARAIAACRPGPRSVRLRRTGRGSPDARFTRVPSDHYSAFTSPEFAAAVTAFPGPAA
ncbi:hypothetical protein [Amycolatopsis vastitatis]|uniref:hypothetical protein n=1 Tax=Amycolatopsis vastitatis TaxID=1905142 RepID=UPI00117790B7|nr:hypothetical protein [Amycolatopsis vastitatis]